MTDVVLILTTFPDDFDPARQRGFMQQLVSSGAAACVSVLPLMESTYRWDGKIAEARERQVLIKTTNDRVAAVQSALAAAHPYDLPEFLVVPVTGGSADYLAWVRG
jgi:periplasmic divalent cation tolerance protein